MDSAAQFGPVPQKSDTGTFHTVEETDDLDIPASSETASSPERSKDERKQFQETKKKHQQLADAYRTALQSGQQPSYRARINVIGHSGAGKTTLIRRLLGKALSQDEDSTCGIETHRVEVNLNEDTIWSDAVQTPAHLHKRIMQDIASSLQQEEQVHVESAGPSEAHKPTEAQSPETDPTEALSSATAPVVHHTQTWIQTLRKTIRLPRRKKRPSLVSSPKVQITETGHSSTKLPPTLPVSPGMMTPTRQQPDPVFLPTEHDSARKEQHTQNKNRNEETKKPLLAIPEELTNMEKNKKRGRRNWHRATLGFRRPD